MKDRELGPGEIGSGEPEDGFEAALRRAMRRVNAPETMAKFLAVAAEAQAARESRGRWAMWFTPRSGGKLLVLSRAPAQALSAVAAALLIGTALAGSVHLRQEHRRNEATREFDESVRITDQAMEHTREQLRRVGVVLDSDGNPLPGR